MLFSLSSAVYGGDTILLNYTAGSITSKDGRAVASFSNFSVTNNVPQFLIVSATTTIDSKTIEAKFNMPISIPTAHIENLTVLINSVSAGIDSIRLKSGNDSTMIFSLAKGIKVNEIVTISYSAGEMASVDGYKLPSFSKYPVTNIVPALAIISASTYGDAKTIIAIFNKPMMDPSALLSSFKMSVNGSLATIDSVRPKPGNDSIIVLTLKNPAKTGDVIQFFYYPGSFASSDGEKLALTRFFNVVNNIQTGVETQTSTGISVYPNPVRNTIYIKGTCISKVYIYNPMGQLVLEKVLNNEDAQIDVSELPAGTYCVSIYTCKGNTLQTKLIKI
jgi:hypothetical protein